LNTLQCSRMRICLTDTETYIHTYIKNIYIAPRINSHYALRSHHTCKQICLMSSFETVKCKPGAQMVDYSNQTLGPAAEKLLSLNHVDFRVMTQVLTSEERGLRRSESDIRFRRQSSAR